MKTGPAAEGAHDRTRVPNELGEKQLQQLAETITAEGTVFDAMFYSPVKRAELLAKRLAPNCAFYLHELYEPDPNSTDPFEAVDGSTCHTANTLFGYDLAKWYGHPVTENIARRRATTSAGIIHTALAEQKIQRVGVVGHFFYLNVLAEVMSNIPHHNVKTTALGECDRFVLVLDRGEIPEELLHVPLGQKITDMYGTEPAKNRIHPSDRPPFL